MSERGAASRFSCRRIVSSRTACRAFASSARRDGACTMTEQTDNLRDPPCPARIRGSNRRQSVGERLSLTVLMCAPPAAQPKLHRYGLALDRQILQASGVQPADFGSAVRNQGGANAERWSGSANNPTVIIGERDTQNFCPWAGRPFRFGLHPIAAGCLTASEPHKVRKTRFKC